MEENNNPNQKDNLEENKNQEQTQNAGQKPVQPQGGQQQPVQPQNPNVQGQRPVQPNMNQAPKKKSNAGIIIAIIVGVLLLISIPIILFIFAVFTFIGKSAKTEINKASEVYNSITNYYDDYENNTTSYNTTNKNTTSKNTTISNSTNKNTTTNTVTNTTNNSSVINSSNPNAKESTKDSPLKINEWGLAAKYVSKYLSEQYADTSYIDVPVRVTNVTRGEEAVTEIKAWCDTQSFYKYQDPKANTEWAVFDYEVDLSNVTFDEGTIGTDTKISSSVKGLDGGSIKYNDITYILSTTDISGNEYKKEPGVYKGKFIVMLPEGCTEYLVKLGDSYNGAESYFRIEE